MPVILLILTLLICPLAQWIAPPPAPATIAAPATLTPTIPASRVEISASATSVRVGETITITGIPVNLGLPIYTLTLSSGASASVSYDNQPRGIPASDDLFEIISAHGEMNRVTFTLRPRAVGTAEVRITATGEAVTAQGAYMWSSGGSDALTLTITD